MAVEVLGYQWDFGDGQTSNLQNPEHTYVMAGTYVWTCTVVFKTGVTLTETGTIYVYEGSYDYEFDSEGNIIFDGPVASRTHECFRVAIPQRIEQGVGWSEYTGSDFVFPVGQVGVCKFKDQNDEIRVLAIDGSTFKIHELARENQWKDGETEYEGTEIESTVIQREEIPPMGAAAILQHEQSHAYIKPWDKSVRNTSEYNGDGFRNDFNMDALIRVDGEPTNHAITREVPYKGQLIFDRVCKSENIQIGWIFRGAPWRFVRAQTWLKQIDSAAPPPKKAMSESDWAYEWGQLTTWLTRNINPAINAATGEEVDTANYAGTVTGRDGYSGSGVSVGAAGSFFVSDVTIGGDFSVSVWLRNIAAINLIQVGNLTIAYNGGLVWNDGVNIQNIVLNQTYGDWTMLTITRDDTILRVYENGTLTNTYNLPSVEVFAGDMTLFGGECDFADFRLKSDCVSEGSILYLFNDMTENYGDATCPVL